MLSHTQSARKHPSRREYDDDTRIVQVVYHCGHRSIGQRIVAYAWWDERSVDIQGYETNQSFNLPAGSLPERLKILIVNFAVYPVTRHDVDRHEIQTTVRRQKETGQILSHIRGHFRHGLNAIHADKRDDHASRYNAQSTHCLRSETPRGIKKTF